MDKKDYKNSVVSLYLNLSPELIATKQYLKTFNVLKTKLLEEKKGFINTLSHSQRNVLTRDLIEIELILRKQITPQMHGVFVLLKSGDELHYKHLEEKPDITDSLTVDMHPRIESFLLLNNVGYS